MMYSSKNIEAVRGQMQQLYDMFKVMFHVQREYYTLLPLEEQKELKNGLIKLNITSAL